MTPLRILVVGEAGREHALAWRLARDPECGELLLAPGNQGMAASLGERARRLAPAELAQVLETAAVDLAVIGPEAPLAEGLADRMRSAGVTVFGPCAAAARLESSKWFAKGVMAAAGIPTARSARVTDRAGLEAALGSLGPGHVLKADGLAAGKGVRVTRSREEAMSFGREAFEGRFGASGKVLVLEEFLEGEEVTVMAVCDGLRHTLLPAARDYKRALDGDLGPNTGGMGAFAPSPALTAALAAEVSQRVVTPLLAEMRRLGTPFTGLLYCGLMLTATGLRVIEFNVRFGDPEAQVVLPLLEGSLARLLHGAARGTLDESAVRPAAGAAVAVALVDEGYPGDLRGGGVIEGLDALEADPALLVFHSGTERGERGWNVTRGRAAWIVARGAGADEARERAYAAVRGLSGAGWRARSDIAAHAGVGASGARS